MQENHPIPQQISSYQFRLVGDMTLKQFFQLAGGCLVALLFYAAPLHPVIKWPIIIFFVVLGVALAFFPIEERPLEKWILAFFRAVYSPTIFTWKKSATLPLYFQPESQIQQGHGAIAPRGEAALNTYLATPTTSTAFFSKLEDSEKTFLSRMGELFGPGSPAKGTVTVAPPPTTQPVEPVLKIPEVPSVNIEAQARPRIVVEETAKPLDVVKTGVNEVTSGSTLPQGQQAVFSQDAAPPDPPRVPNTVSGQVIGPDGKIIEGAILEIRDISGRPVRALRSNKLGHFYIVTALINGTYEIITDKDGFEFAPVKFETTGALIPPMAIRSTRKINVSSETVQGPIMQAVGM